MAIVDELRELHELRVAGAINDDEFAAAKARILENNSAPQPDWTPAYLGDVGPSKDDAETRKWAMLLHFSVLPSYFIPVAGFAVPVAIWLIKKDELPGIDQHGKNAVNWIISHLIYFVACIVLMIVLIGIPLFIALGILSVIFPIIAGIKAKSGMVWKYPLAIPFF